MCWALLPARAYAMQKQHSRHFAPQNKEDLIMSNNELLEALNILEQEKNISKDTLLEAIENSLVTCLLYTSPSPRDA